MTKATLAINIISDASGAKAGLNDAASGVEKFQRGLDKASVASGAVLGGLGLLAKGAFDAASDLQQTTGAINSVFGDWALDIEQSAQKAANSVGLSASAYEGLASVLGSQLKGAGMNIGDVTAKTQDLITMGADLAATFGGTTADAVEALSSVLKGETDPIEAYGVSIKQSDINARLAALGQDQLTGSALKAATANAALSLVADQTSASVGAYTAQLGSAAEQQQNATANWENAKATLGDQLLPVVTNLAQKLSELATWASENQGVVTALAIAIGGLSAATIVVNAAMTAWRTISILATAAQWLWNVAMSANPLMLIVLAIAAVVAIVILMYNKFEWFRDLVGSVADFFKNSWNTFTGLIQKVWDKVGGLGGIFESVFGWISKVMSPVTDAIKWVVDKIKWLLDKAGAVGSFIGGLFSAPAPAPGGVPAARGLFGAAPGMRAAGLLTAGGGGTSPAAASGAFGGTTVNVTVNGALDPVAVGRQIQNVLRDYSRRTGGQVAVAL